MKLRSVAVGMCVMVLLCASAYAAEDAASALVLHLKFDEGSGKAAKDSSGKGNDGALQGSCKWVKGKVGKALEFDGKGAYVDVMILSPIDFDKSFTIMAWVKTTATDLKLSRTVITNLRNSRERKGFAIFDEYGKYRINVYRTTADKANKKANYETCSLGFFEKDKWVHMAVVVNFEDDSMRIFKNGKDVRASYHADASKNNWHNSALLRVGAEQVGTKEPYFFTGVIDDVRIYQKALSEAEVRKLYGSEK